VNNDVDNTTDTFAAQADEPPVPSNPPPDIDAAAFPSSEPPAAMPGESVDMESQAGPDDLTGRTDSPESTDAAESEHAPGESLEEPSQVEHAHAAPAQPAPRVKETKKAKATPPPAAAIAEPAEGEVNRQWYILKVQTNREESIRDALQRRVAMAGLEKYFGEIIVPTEMVSEFKGGKKRVSKRKLYPGYIVVNMEINDDTWYLVRETSGIGDFTGAMGRPTPMAPQDVAKIVAKTEEKTDEAPRVDIRFKPADRVRIKEGTFENFEGNVEAIDQANGRVTVMINIFGRSTPVELEYWQIEAV
jgi:transcription termination/antitermination protein NusG